MTTPATPDQPTWGEGECGVCAKRHPNQGCADANCMHDCAAWAYTLFLAGRSPAPLLMRHVVIATNARTAGICLVNAQSVVFGTRVVNQ